MIHNTKFYHGARKVFLCSIMVIAAMLMTTSCGDDEPNEMLINYYIDVEEPFLVNSDDDFTDRYYNPVKLMKEAIQNTYPTPDAKGSDEAVIAMMPGIAYCLRSVLTGFTPSSVGTEVPLIVYPPVPTRTGAKNMRESASWKWLRSPGRSRMPYRLSRRRACGKVRPGCR